MKKLITTFTYSLLLLIDFSSLYASAMELPIIYINSQSAVHFRSPEPLSYVDLPGSSLQGDLPLKNLLRIRTKELGPENRELGVLSVTGEHFLAQYRIIYLCQQDAKLSSEIEILPSHMVPLIPLEPSLSTPQIRLKALEAISSKIIKPLARESHQSVEIRLNQILCSAELVFLDLSFVNSSALSYRIEELSFVVRDKKISRSTNFQQFPLEPRYILDPLPGFSKKARNIYVLPRASFSASKQLLISLKETQPSSRTVSLALDYRDILSADRF